VQAVILGRLDRLDPELRRVVSGAAVIGRVFGRRVLARALGEGTSLDRALWTLEDRAWIYQERTVPEVEYSFRHVLAREAVYRSIVRDERRALHLQVAQSIEALYGDRLTAHWEQLAHHYEQGQDPARAVDYMLRAGQKARRENANEAAIIHLERGLEMLEPVPPGAARDRRQLDLLIALGVPTVLTRGHGDAEVERVYRQAEALCGAECALTQRFEIILGLRRVLLIRGDLPRARVRGQELLALAQAMGDPVYLCRAHVMQGEALYHMGLFGGARAHYIQAQALYDPAQARTHVFRFGNDSRVCAEVFAGQVLWHLGCVDQAAEAVAAGVAHAEALDHPFTLCMALHAGAMVYLLRRETDVAAAMLERGRPVASQFGFALYEAWSQAARGWALEQRGQLEDGIELLRAGIAAWRAIGAETKLVEWMACLGEAYAAVGWTESGLRAIDEALALADRHAEHGWTAQLHRLRGVLLLARGATAEAKACYEKALDVARTQKARSWQLRAAVDLARLCGSEGRGAAARALLQEVLDGFAEGADTVDQRRARSLVGERQRRR
jgi:adenylate cyclase